MTGACFPGRKAVPEHSEVVVGSQEGVSGLPGTSPELF